MKIVIEIPEKTYQKIITGTYDYGDMNVIIQNGTPYEERPHGEWMFDEDGYFSCSCCKRKPAYQVTTMDFCSNCGADMRKEGESN